MPAITFYRHGVTASNPNMGNPNPPKRGKIKGWSATAARRNMQFLRSIDERELSGHGYAITLTLRDCPPTPKAWSDAVKAWLKRLRRKGMIRYHWVMEFQARGVPHLHAAIWFDEPQNLNILDDWCEIAAPFGAGSKGQKSRKIDGVIGWFKYMAKHCSRSKSHYQRQKKSLPKEWETSGRTWGKGGDWTIVEPFKGDLTRPQFWSFRRLIKRRRLAEAREGLPLNASQVGYLRRVLKCDDRKLSEVRPMSEWIPASAQSQLMEVACLIARTGATNGEPERHAWSHLGD